MDSRLALLRIQLWTAVQQLQGDDLDELRALVDELHAHLHITDS